jgi:arsenite oxidase small subunit
MKRRSFIKLCTAAAACTAASGPLFAQSERVPRQYARARLVRPHGEPLKAAELVAGRNYVFHYPYAGTPCFLLDLGRSAGEETALRTENGERYTWRGGVGPRRSIVSYSAICAHRMAYPTRQVSFISYRTEPYELENGPNGRPATVREVIVCCAEGSVYDPATGARVLAGPAGQPLASILLEYDADSDELFAVGTYGGEMFHQFFEDFGARLVLEHGGENRASQPVGDTAEVQELEEFTGNRITC